LDTGSLGDNNIQLKKKKGLLDQTPSRLGLDAGSDFGSPKLRPKVNSLKSPLGFSSPSEEGPSNEEGDFRRSSDNPATSALIDNTKKKKQNPFLV